MSLRFQNVSFSYGEKKALKDFSYDFPEKGIVCLFGPSGCGKTTVFRLICGLETPQQGSIENLPQMPSVVFQEDRLLPWKTVKENIKIAGLHEDMWLEMVGLKEAEDQYPKELSGGMQRRVALARAFSAEYDVLLLDEPFTGLEEERILDLAKIIKEIAKEKLVLMITHKIEEAQLCEATIIHLK